MCRFLQSLVISKGTQLTLTLVAILAVVAIGIRRAAKERARQSAETYEPSLLRKHSSFESYKTPSGHVYKNVRTFYHPHSKADKLPHLPLLVCLHGLGGSTAQFASLLNSLVCIAPCLSIDLPGCGRSAIDAKMPTSAFSTGSLAELLAAAIDRFQDRASSQKVILVGHSLGCSISALLVSSHSPMKKHMSFEIAGFVAMCPRAHELTSKELSSLAWLRYMPPWLFDCLRVLDRIGGINAKNVLRFVGESVDDETKKMQVRYNEQSRSETLLAMLSSWAQADKARYPPAGFPARNIWEGINVPLYLITAGADRVTLPREAQVIARWLTQYRGSKVQRQTETFSKTLKEELESIDEIERPPGNKYRKQSGSKMPTWTNERLIYASEANTPGGQAKDEEVPSSHGPTSWAATVQLTVVPSPASHGLIYTPSTVHIVSGLIQHFLSENVSPHLSPAWQLQHLSTSGKWDVKNYTKWFKIDPCSEPIGGVFRGMKTMRNDDATHSPRTFAENFGPRSGVQRPVVTIIDISHENPVYRPEELAPGGIEYRKLPTVSKVPPTTEEVRAFDALVDGIRTIHGVSPTGYGPTVAVHCHYGFNRTGMFIICYLVERLGWDLQDAIDEFAAKRPPGIKHVYFVDELFLRYGVNGGRKGSLVA
ncbi:hypothetical protein MBLNU230_g1263t1 [Neophaeotheca triangularis]